MSRRKINIQQVIASIRLDIKKKYGIEVPTETIHIRWKGGDRGVIVDVGQKLVFSSVDGRVMLEGKI